MTGFIGMLHRHDERVLHFLVARRYRLLDRAMRVLTHLADPLPAIAVGLALTYWPPTSRAGQRGFFALAVSHIFVQVLKRWCNRPRPTLPVGIQSLVRAPDRFSFPSGHAAASMAITLAVAAVMPWTLALPVIVLALLVGASRSYLGVHYPGDVLAGWLLANLCYLLGGVVL